MSSTENLSPQILQNLSREIRDLAKSPPDGIKLITNETSFTEIVADIEGPEGTPYERGSFRCKLVLGNSFPIVAPRGYFLTKLFHPNVSPGGDICVNTLKKDWTPNMGLKRILQIIRCLLIVPFPESAMNEEASRLFLDSYEEFFKRAKLLTSIHAIKCSKPTIGEKQSLSTTETVNKRKRLSLGTNSSTLKKKLSKRKKSLKRL